MIEAEREVRWTGHNIFTINYLKNKHAHEGCINSVDEKVYRSSLYNVQRLDVT